MNKRLVIVSGPEVGRTIPLIEGTSVTIGRGQASNEQLNDPRVSRVHCRLDVGAEESTLSDDGSTGGTFVGGKRITQHRLSNGDEIQIGRTCIKYEEASRSGSANSASSTSRLSAQRLKDLVGQSLGHFRIESLRHTGSTSLLFKAQDEKHLRPAMVKVMLPTIMSDDEKRSRFVRAVHTMINVRHNNLVEVYGAGQQGELCWCAMEFVDGISILEIIELLGTQGRLDWKEVYRVATHVARGLECAYRHKVIHRNVTPDNLIQRKNDKVVKLCDLMLAKALDGVQTRQVTAPGQLIGNVAYMSPERMIDTGNLDWRSDQYGLGATLFALLTGNPPFENASLQQLVNSIRTEIPTFPEDVQLETPFEFRELVLQMLRKDPDDRIHYPSELLRRLDEVGKAYDIDADVLFNA